MTESYESETWNQELELLQSENIILVTPFHNEESTIPHFFDKIAATRKINNIYFLGVNHRSNDNSEQAFSVVVEPLGRHSIVQEATDVPSVGIPRQKGILRALELARKEKIKGRKIVIGSIDIDSAVPPSYFDEAQSFAESNADFLVFPTRYDPHRLLECINAQTNDDSRDAAIHNLLGIDWMKFNLRSFLLNSGAIETRGSGGYFFSIDGYDKAGGHKPLYSTDGRLIVGESNALGIRATHADASYVISDSVVTANPRRMLQSILKKNEGYVVKKEGKTFEAISNDVIMPTLTEVGWDRHFAISLSDALRTFAIKGIAYGVSYNIRHYIDGSPLFNQLMDRMQAKYNVTQFGGDEKEAIGSGVYMSMYSEALQEMGNDALTLLRDFAQSIPTNDELVTWAITDYGIKPINKLTL